jgi:hypothetical protein
VAKGRKSIVLAEEAVANKIYYLRKKKVMLGRDLAALYGVMPIRLREQVKRNLNRFPSKFMFQLTEKEVQTMVSQNAIPSKQHLGGYLPYAFTEHGVLMLASILKSEKAMQVSIRIIEIFVKMREVLSTRKDVLLELQKIEKRISGHDQEIQLIFEYLKQLINPPQEPRRRIGFRRSNEE